jgi:hypothetical protein
MPATLEWLGIFNSMLTLGINPYNWKQVNDTDLTPQEAAAACYDILLKFIASATLACNGDVPTPYWDDAGDLDDELPVEIQPWYGEVVDYTAPPYELTFVEAAGIWVIEGFVFYAAGVGAAVAFQTIAPRFVLAWKRRDIGELFRVVIDAADYSTVDTSGFAENDIIELPVLPDQGLEAHDILIIKVG